MTQIHDLTVLELAAAIRGRELSPTEITGHYLDRIERLNAEVPSLALRELEGPL